MSAKKFFFKALLEISLKHPWGGVNECTRFPNRVFGRGHFTQRRSTWVADFTATLRKTLLLG